MDRARVESWVRDATATQLGAIVSDVTMDTVIPDIQAMAEFACFSLNKVINIPDVQAKYTVAMAIEKFAN